LLQEFKTTNESCSVPMQAFLRYFNSYPYYKWYFPNTLRIKYQAMENHNRH